MSPPTSTDQSDNRKKPTPDGRWQEMYQRLEQYKQKNGHCLVPNRYEEDPQLGAWVSTQRRHYKLIEAREASPLTENRIAQLEKLDFKWAAKCPRHVQWESRFQALLRFKEKFGHTQVPINWEQDTQLANWVSTQRQEYQNLVKGKTTRLDKRRIGLLTDIGFSWQLQRGGRKRHLQEVSHSSDPQEESRSLSAPQPKKLSPASTVSGTSSSRASAKTSGLTFGGKEVANTEPEQKKLHPIAVAHLGSMIAKQAEYETQLGSSLPPPIDHASVLARSDIASANNSNNLDYRHSVPTTVPTGSLLSQTMGMGMSAGASQEALLINRLSQNAGLSPSLLRLLGVDASSGTGPSIFAPSSSQPLGWQGSAAARQSALRQHSSSWTTPNHGQTIADLAAFGLSAPRMQQAAQAQSASIPTAGLDIGLLNPRNTARLFATNTSAATSSIIDALSDNTLMDAARKRAALLIQDAPPGARRGNTSTSTGANTNEFFGSKHF